MTKLKRWTALALCCLLALTAAACGAGPDSSAPGGEGAKGRYVETDITPPGAEGETLTSFLAADGSLVCYTQDLKKMFTSGDGGESWTEAEGPGAKASLNGRVDSFTLLADGSLLAALTDEVDYTATGLVKISPDGAVEPFTVPALEEAIATGKTTYVSQLKALSADRLFLSFASGDFGAMSAGTPEDESEGEGEDAAQNENAPEGAVAAPPAEGETAEPEEGEEEGENGGLFSAGEQTNFAGLIDLASGEALAEYPDWYGVAATADADTLYMLDYGGDILAKSLADGSAKKEGEAKLAVDEFAFNLNFTVGEDGLYVMDGKRILKVPAGGEAETLIDGSSYAFGGTGGMANGIHTLQNGDIVLNLLSQNSTRLYKYTWDENAELDPAKVLKVWSLYENYLVRAAISRLRSQNPDASVEYEVALSGDDGVTAEDAIKTLNTRLLNGDGPDVMILDGCPAESYAARGMLQDLSGLVSSDGMFENIAAPFTGENGTFYLPMNIKLPLLLGTGESLAKAGSLEELAALAENGPGLPQLGDTDDVFASLPEDERPALAPDGLEELFNVLWNTNAGSIVTPDGLDAEALRSTLAALQKISDKYGLAKDGGGAASGAVAMMASDGGAAATVTGSALAYASQRALLGAYTADDMQMLQMMTEPPGSEFVSFPGLIPGSFVPMCVAGISADSEKPELAAEFVNAMLGDEVQGTRTGSGFPVTEAGIQKQIADIDALMQEHQKIPFEFDYAPLMALAQTPQLADDVVKDMVWAVAQQLCEGKTDLEGAVKQLEQDLKNYLAERQ